MLAIAQRLGISWDGSMYEGEPRGEFSEKQRAILKAVMALPDDKTELAKADLDATDLKGLLSAQQMTALQAYQQQLKDERDDELLEKLTKDFLRLAYQLGEAGKALTADNLKPWRDKVKAALGR